MYLLFSARHLRRHVQLGRHYISQKGRVRHWFLKNPYIPGKISGQPFPNSHSQSSRYWPHQFHSLHFYHRAYRLFVSWILKSTEYSISRYFRTFALPFEVTARIGQLLFLAYDCCSWSHLMITLNRFTFTFFPFDYAEVFTRFSTMLYVVSSPRNLRGAKTRHISSY